MATDDGRGTEPSTRSVEVPVDVYDDVPVAVVFAVAEVLGCDPNDLEAELDAFVDADALTQLFAPRRSGPRRTDGRVVFEMLDCEVTVESSGLVRATPTGPDSDRAEGGDDAATSD
jgi:hypothetical protein